MQESLPKLLELLLMDNYETSIEAGRELVKLGAIAVPELIKLVRGEGLEQRSSSAQIEPRTLAGGVLANMGEPAVLPLIELLSDADAETRWRAVDALGLIGDIRALPFLLSLFNDPSDLVRNSAPYSLDHFLEKSEAVEALLKALEDADWKVRQGSLYELGKAYVVAGRPDQIKHRIIEMLDDKSAFVRGPACSTVADIGAKEALPRLEWMVEHDQALDEWGQLPVSRRAAFAIETIKELPAE
jgi:HEAT repeat protein